MQYLSLTITEKWEICRLDNLSVDDLLGQSGISRARRLLFAVAFESMEIPEAERVRLEQAGIPLVDDVPDVFMDAPEAELTNYLQTRLATFVSVEPPLVTEDPFWRDARRLLSDEDRQKLLRLINGEDDYED